MMKTGCSIKKKLLSRSAETLTETLVSVMIISIVSVALATMIGTASRINEKARDYDKALDESIKTLSNNYISDPGMTVSIKVSDDVEVTESFTVSLYGDKDNLNLYAYYYPAMPQSGGEVKNE